jgi:tetratricopeptide (TPR) repeat protein
VEDGRSLWTGKFDESFTDIFEVEDLISEKVADALAEITVALSLDPLSLAISDSAGEILYFARRYHEAIEQFQKALEMDPTPPASRINLGRAYEQGVARRVYLTVDPRLDRLYRDARFRELVRKVGLALSLLQ